MSPELKASLLATLRARGPSKLADELEKLSPREVQAYLRDFAKRHPKGIAAIQDGASPAQAARLDR